MRAPVIPKPSEGQQGGIRDTGIMPWQVVAAGFTALLSLTLTAGFLPLTPFFVLAILLSYIVPARLEGQTFNRWWVRIAMIIIIIVMNQGDVSNSDFAIGGARTRNIFAQVYAAELVVQCWRRSGNPVQSRLIAIVASGLLMLSAANTFDDHYIKFIAPVYVLFVGLSLYTGRVRSLSRWASVIHVFFLIIAIGIGGGAYVTVETNRSRLTELGNRLLGERFSTESSGMSASPQLGETFGLRGSTVRVLRIHHFAGDGHLRGMAFYTYDQGRWGPGYTDRRYRSPREGDLNPVTATRVNASEMQVERLASDNPLIYAPLQSSSISVGDAIDTEWAPEMGGPIRTRARPPYEYRVTVATNDKYQGLLAVPLKDNGRDVYLKIPENFDPRVAEIARKITVGATTDAEKVEAVTNYLLSNYSYSLRFHPGAGDPLVNFLTAEPKRPAHCEYFAAASAILLRCVGVPTRYVTGYLAHESDGPDTTIIRQRDAHAWSEAWVEGVGWVTVDATPGDGRPDADTTPVEWWRRLLEKLQDGAQAFAEFLAGLSFEQVTIIVVTIVVGGIIYGVRLYRKRQMAKALASFAYTRPNLELAELIVRFEAVFAKRNAAFPPEQTYREHLDTLSRVTVAKTNSPSNILPLLDSARQFVTLYDATRFGNRQSPETLNTLRRLVEEMERTR